MGNCLWQFLPYYSCSVAVEFVLLVSILHWCTADMDSKVYIVYQYIVHKYIVYKYIVYKYIVYIFFWENFYLQTELSIETLFKPTVILLIVKSTIGPLTLLYRSNLGSQIDPRLLWESVRTIEVDLSSHSSVRIQIALLTSINLTHYGVNTVYFLLKHYIITTHDIPNNTLLIITSWFMKI